MEGIVGKVVEERAERGEGDYVLEFVE